MKRKNVLLIIPEMSTGGAQRSLANISLELSKYFNVWFAVFNLAEPVAYAHGGQLLNLNVIPGKSIFSKLASFYKRVSRLKKIKRDMDIHVSISFLEGADYVNVLSRQSEKVVLSIRGSKIHDEIMRSSSFWLRSKVLIPWLYRKANTIVPVNKGIGHELTTQYGLDAKKIRVIGNFYNPEEILKLSTDGKSPPLEQFYKDHAVLVSAGRLNREKGLSFLIRIFAKLRQLNSKAKLVLVGDGPEKENLHSLCTQLGLSVSFDETFNQAPDVLFTGNQSNVYKYLRNAMLYITNSSSEGFPNGIVEAMICGVPVVSSDCPYGPAEILAPEGKNVFGTLLPIANSDTTAELWVNAIAALLKDDVQRIKMAEQAFRRAAEFRKEEVINQWLNLIHE